MMKIGIAEATRNLGVGFPFAFRTTAEELDASGADFSFSGEVSVSGALSYTGVSYHVLGKVTALESFLCDRCLAPCEENVELDFSEEYGGEGESISGEEIDIEDLVRDTLLAGVSLSHLCRPDCKGLCPVCGQNLNEGTCSCDTFVPDPRLAALQQLLKDNN